MKKHHKHPKITRPAGGDFHRNEWAILGAPCSIIEKLVNALQLNFEQKKISTGFLDQDHVKQTLSSSGITRYTDKIDYYKIESKEKVLFKSFRRLFNHLDLLLVNGNHFKAEKQIVIINEKKRESLQRKMDRLTDLGLIVLDNGMDAPFDFLKEKIKGVPVLRIEEINKIFNLILEDYFQNIPTLNGLVLIGGKSQRMGEPKEKIKYKSKEHGEYTAELLSDLGLKTYYSVSEKLYSDEMSSYEYIHDSFSDLGPYGGILSAFKFDPNKAWLTLPCDLPFIDKGSLSQLIENRNPGKLATCFYNPETDFPEPLITIWEPRAYTVLLEFLALGYACPRKVLINSDIEMIKMNDAYKMINANLPEEKLLALEKLSINENDT